MTLSLCLIARNEAHNLPRALESFRGICDEIVLADTGSSDDTAQVARALGARVFDVPWTDDFAAARNACIAHARGEWIFWLDADEMLLPESRPALTACLGRADAAGWFVLRQDLARIDRTDWFTEMWQLRLFRRDPRLRFVGRCHPDFRPSLTQIAAGDGRSVLASRVRLRHWGYVAELRPAKLRRAARLLELELRDRPGQLYYEVEYARTLHALGESREADRMLAVATDHMLVHRDDPSPPASVAEGLLEWLIASPEPSRPPGRGLTDARLSDLARRWFPRSAPLAWALARRSCDAGDFAAAAMLLEALVRMGREGTYDRYTSFDPRLLHEDAVLNLAVCRIRLAELDSAEALLRSLAGTPRQAEADANLAAVARLRSLGDATNGV
jgi:hypothetical protein